MFSSIKIPKTKINIKYSKMRAFSWLALANLAVIISVAIVTGGDGLHFAPLLLLAGCLSPFVSLLLSRWSVKRYYTMQILSANESDYSLRELYQMVDTLRQRANIEQMPEVAIYESDEVNAFATGKNRNSALVAFSSGLINTLTPEDIAAIAAHEIAHIANGDMIIMTLVESVVNSITALITIPLWFLQLTSLFSEDVGYAANFIIWMVRLAISAILMFLGMLVVNLFSRKREFAADKLASELLSKQFMIDALKKLQAANDLIDEDKSHAKFNALKITTKLSAFGDIFSTHPSLERRIEALVLANNIIDGGAYSTIIDVPAITLQSSPKEENHNSPIMTQKNNPPVMTKTETPTQQPIWSTTMNRELLLKIVTSVISDGYYTSGNIPALKLQNAMQTYPIDPSDEVLALVDATVMGSAKAGLAIGTKGVYLRNDWTSKTTRNFISWSELAKSPAPIGNGSMSCIYLAPGCEFNISGASMNKTVLINLLNQIVTSYKSEMAANNEASNPAVTTKTSAPHYTPVVLILLSILIVADGEINEPLTEFASSILEHDDYIAESAQAMALLAEQIENYLQLRASSDTIFKLKIAPAINAVANLNSEERERILIIITGALDYVKEKIVATEIIALIKNKLVH